MDPLTLSLIGGVAAPAIGGVIGNLLSAGDREKAQAAITQSVQELQNIGVPAVEAQRIALQRYSSVGDLSPLLKQYSAEELGPSAVSQISTDPRLAQAQNEQLKQLQEQGRTGITPVEKAQLNAIRNQTEADAQSRMQGILAQKAARGQLSGGDELTAQMMESQAAAQRQSQESQNQASDAYRNALQAVSSAGGLANQMQSTQFGQAAQKASATDAINQFNAMSRQSANNSNVGQANQAAQFDLSNKQNIANQNTGVGNQQEMYNKNLLQQNYQNQLTRQQSINQARQGQAQQYQQNANGTANMWTGIGGAVGSGAAAYGQQQNTNKLISALGKK